MMIEISIYYILGFFATLSAIFIYLAKVSEYGTGREMLMTFIAIFSVLFTVICLVYIIINNVRFVL